MAEKKEIYKEIFEEYKKQIEYKNAIGNKGLYEQAKINERFYVGDQWHGAQAGNDRPLVRQNVIKRIGDYKISVVSGSPVSVNYTADGVPNTVGFSDNITEIEQAMAENSEMINGFSSAEAGNDEINLVMSALSDYFKVTAERLKFDAKKEQALRNAYISGAGVLYTYWDSTVKTGLYADKTKTKPITGDIACDVIDIENVYFGDPNCDDVQKQPYIILAQRKSVTELKREAKSYGAGNAVLEEIKADSDYKYMSGDYGQDESYEARKATVLIKMWKEYHENGMDYDIKAIKVVEGAVIRPEWDMKIRLYPISLFTWERRRNNIYGEAEITYLIPNQIAINRMLTASVWAVMLLGMPMLVVNDQLVPDFSNQPGQVIRTQGEASDVQRAVSYVVPPNFSPNFDNMVNSLISGTLTHSGANEAALGDIRPDNTSAIVAVREAATMPLQTVQNRYYQFIEDTARIWAEFWISLYGERSIKMVDGANVWYMPFDGKRYENLVLSARVDVGSSTLYGEAQTIQTLGNLFDRQMIDTLQYLERLPKGLIPDLSGLIKQLKEANAAMQQQEALMQQQNAMQSDMLAALTPEERAVFEQLPQEQQQQMMNQSMQEGSAQ